MFDARIPSLKRLRVVLVALIVALASALLVQPAAAANLHSFDHNAVLAVAGIGVLLLAIVVEVWRASKGDDVPGAFKTDKQPTSGHSRHN